MSGAEERRLPPAPIYGNHDARFWEPTTRRRFRDELIEPKAWLAAGGLVLIGMYVGSLAWTMQHGSYDVWGGMLLLPILVAVSIPVVRLVTRHDDVPMPGLLTIALVAKLLGTFVRYFVLFTVYGGAGDAEAYHSVAKQLSDQFRNGQLPLLSVFPHTVGTRFIVELTAFVYTLLGPTKLGGFLVFSWFGFWGLFLLYRASLIGFPELDHRRYALLLFFLPSFLFWPSSIGKEAWLMLGLGISCYGAARLLADRRFGVTLAALGCVLTGFVRPHVALLLVAALALAFVVRRSSGHRSLGAPLRRLGVIAVLVVGMTVALSWTDRLLGTGEGTTAVSLGDVLDRTAQRTTEGGSEFATERPNKPWEYPIAFVAVMVRPSLLDARNFGQLLSALETTALAAVFVLSLERIREVGRLLLRVPYLLYCTAYSAMFSFAWSSIGNFGILVRQRVLAWPLLLVMLAVAPRPKGAAVGDPRTVDSSPPPVTR